MTPFCLQRFRQFCLIVVSLSAGLCQSLQSPAVSGFRKCADCRSEARRRVAVMPVRVINLPPELGLTPEWMAGAVRERLERSIAQSPAFTSVDRTKLDAVLKELGLGQPQGFSEGLPAQTSRTIPAQFLLTTTVDGIHLWTSAKDAPTAGGDTQQKLAPRTYSTWLMIGLIWRVLDASTGAVIASGPSAATGSASEKQLMLEAAGANLYAGLLGRVLERVVADQWGEVQRQIGGRPFRAGVVRVDQEGVVLDCGANARLSVGDSFGVSRRPGPPAGLIRVSEVRESTAVGQVLEEAGPLAPGDDLVWVGVYVPSSP
ncbi:MAG: hypothetical protein ACE141_09585 [Bryobacteraceae bacterium]